MSALQTLRIFALLEGTSFLGLLLVAMPLKYVFGIPAAVRVAGSVHGLLFLVFLAALFSAVSERGWGPRRYLFAVGASVVPGGTILLDRWLKTEIEANDVPRRSEGE